LPPSDNRQKLTPDAADLGALRQFLPPMTVDREEQRRATFDRIAVAR
jgi:hypothetical protein